VVDSARSLNDSVPYPEESGLTDHGLFKGPEGKWWRPGRRYGLEGTISVVSSTKPE
jgi:hypothetical protein